MPALTVTAYFWPFLMTIRLRCDPETGKPFWSVPYEADAGSIIMTPVHAAGHLFAGGFNKRNLMVKLADERPAAETVWRDKARHALSAVNVQPFAEGDLIYGIDADGTLMAFQVPSGERLWQTTQPVSDRRAPNGACSVERAMLVAPPLFSSDGGRVMPEGRRLEIAHNSRQVRP